MQLNTTEGRRERCDLITMYKLINNLEKTDRKGLILRRQEEDGYLKGHKKKLVKEICLDDTEKYSFPQRNYRYLKCTEGRKR